MRRCVGLACSLEHRFTLSAWRKLDRFLADFFRPISQAILKDIVCLRRRRFNMALLPC